MHEMALAMSMLEILEDEARKQNFSRVKKVWLELGALSHVDPRALAFGFESACAGTIAAGAQLELRKRPGRAYCVPCGEEVDVDRRGAPCPNCAGYQLLLTEGEEMKLVELEVE